MHFNVWILVYIYFSSTSFIFLKFGLFVGHCSVKTLELKTIFGGKDYLAVITLHIHCFPLHTENTRFGFWFSNS